MLDSLSLRLKVSTRKIWLTQGQFALVDDADYAWLNQWTWHAVYNATADSYYARRNETLLTGKRILIWMHRQILGLKRGDKRTGDHIHHDTLDNRRSNLWIVTYRENSQNRRDGSSKYPGVHLIKKYLKWKAQIKINKKIKYLGLFDTEKEASDVYQIALRDVLVGEALEMYL